jgi:hypothetical protein
MKPTFPGLKALLLSLRPNRGSAGIAALRARALFQLPESAMTKRRRSLLEFLGQVSLFEDLRRSASSTFSIIRPASHRMVSNSIRSWRFCLCSQSPSHTE